MGIEHPNTVSWLVTSFRDDSFISECYVLPRLHPTETQLGGKMAPFLALSVRFGDKLGK